MTTETILVPIDKKSELKPGDTIVLHYKPIGSLLWLRAAQVAMFENYLRLKPKYELIRSVYDDDDFAFTLRIRQPQGQPGLITKISVETINAGILAIAAPLFLFDTLKSAYKVVVKTIEKIAIGGVAIIIALIIGYLLLLRKK